MLTVEPKGKTEAATGLRMPRLSVAQAMVTGSVPDEEEVE